MADAFFVGPGGMDPRRHFVALAEAVTHPKEGDLLLAGNYLRGEIRDRTFAGLTVDSSPFASYSAAYAKRKGQTNVDLYSRGASRHMLDALTVRAGDSFIELGIYGDEAVATRAQVHNEGGQIPTRLGKGKGKPKKGGQAFATMPARPWLGATDSNLTHMAEIIIQSQKQRVEAGNVA